MKTTLKYLSLLLAVSLCYAACKKTESSPSKSPFNPADFSRQLAVNLYKSLSGQYGGADINDGIKAPSGITAPNHKGPGTNTINPYCGLAIDTTYTASETVSDSVKNYYTRFKFVYGCENNVLNSYSLQDSVANTVTCQQYKAVYKLTQHYNVKALDQTYKTSSVEGSISFSSHIDVNTQSGVQYTYLDSYYALHGIKVDISSGTADVIEGSASINGVFKYKDAVYNVNNSITGSIEFLGNHTSRVTLQIDGNGNYVYLVNMLTGQVTKI
ncbi:hypothetical protein [Mucilaginibacter panaciglaebae]|uniref:Adhesin domain-containing protein n=1 Tax=Mucilaginibacter panaciglaebae TaxID=502331 RepID=A0ABP7X2S3_9SPHI